jgi:hypothetical protein
MHGQDQVRLSRWRRLVKLTVTVIPSPIRLVQGWNRYSYVGNDPLAFTDPNGFSWLSSFFHSVSNPISIAWNSVTYFLATNSITRDPADRAQRYTFSLGADRRRDQRGGGDRVVRRESRADVAGGRDRRRDSARAR